MEDNIDVLQKSMTPNTTGDFWAPQNTGRRSKAGGGGGGAGGGGGGDGGGAGGGKSSLVQRCDTEHGLVLSCHAPDLSECVCVCVCVCVVTAGSTC